MTSNFCVSPHLYSIFLRRDCFRFAKQSNLKAIALAIPELHTIYSNRASSCPWKEGGFPSGFSVGPLPISFGAIHRIAFHCHSPVILQHKALWLAPHPPAQLYILKCISSHTYQQYPILLCHQDHVENICQLNKCDKGKNCLTLVTEYIFSVDDEPGAAACQGNGTVMQIQLSLVRRQICRRVYDSQHTPLSEATAWKLLLNPQVHAYFAVMLKKARTQS